MKLKKTMITYNDLVDLLRENRTVRIFDESRPVGVDLLRSLVGLCRYTASGRNAQPLRYRLVTAPAERESLFPLLAWAGYYADWAAPAEGERPAAYLVQCLDTYYGPNCLCDDGLQLEAITLGAVAMGLRGCIIKAFKVNGVKEALALPEGLIPRYVLALGYPAEKVELETMSGKHDADFKYYRTPDGVHHVPKRPLDELIVG